MIHISLRVDKIHDARDLRREQLDFPSSCSFLFSVLTSQVIFCFYGKWRPSLISLVCLRLQNSTRYQLNTSPP